MLVTFTIKGPKGTLTKSLNHSMARAGIVLHLCELWFGTGNYILLHKRFRLGPDDRVLDGDELVLKRKNWLMRAMEWSSRKITDSLGRILLAILFITLFLCNLFLLECNRSLRDEVSLYRNLYENTVITLHK